MLGGDDSFNRLIVQPELRAQFEGGTSANPDNYIDTSYYQKTLAGM